MDSTRIDDVGGFAARYSALASRDARFDGQFIAGVHSTGIYCRPSCPAMTPKPGNVSFYRTAAAAHEAGLRACKRCQPDAVPGSPDWNLRDDLASRAMRLVHDGVVEREGVPGLAARLGYTSRHVTRVLTAELGAGPLALARAHRAQTARSLLAATDLPIADIAYAAGFGSLRQFNDTIAAVYRATPTELRALARRGAPTSDDAGTITLRLPARAPFDAPGLFRFFADHGIRGFEEGDDTRFARPLPLPGGRAQIEVTPDPAGVVLTARLAALSDLPALTARVRRMFDLDADSVAIDGHLARDPDLAPLVDAVPGIRIPGSASGEEALFRTLVGQQISVAAARTVLGRIVDHFGDFPTAAQLADRGPEVLRGPATRVAAIRHIATVIAAGDLPLDPATPVAELRARLLALPGVGPWTAEYLAMRALGHPDAFPATDLVLAQSAAALGITPSPRPAWAPWRSYAALHLWRARP
ncbi:AlkA N-terminal domain-containing protein [Pseudolysinimonas yzui]|uniref:DNA-3-methyladenine glycosylase II n=1 Tax=Pseudolysinimonas yzui TaxID=2708254 RepID=A0A8J3LZY4_9MICO|nr:AlkA N-terminal domain-containing protein [Pseudolysinimonas yzui]GHF11607.1 DNA-3-methyladenine glycosylase [Pseudolysinimonas yzui]